MKIPKRFLGYLSKGELTPNSYKELYAVIENDIGCYRVMAFCATQMRAEEVHDAFKKSASAMGNKHCKYSILLIPQRRTKP